MSAMFRTGLLVAGLVCGATTGATTGAGASVIDHATGAAPTPRDGVQGRGDWVFDPAVRAHAALAALARELRAQGDYQTILFAADHLEALLPGNRTLAHLHALARAAAGEADAAHTLLDRHPPEAADHWGQLATALLARDAGDLVAAAAAADAVLTADPDNAYAWNVSGTIAFATDDAATAAERFARAAALAPRGAAYAANLGAARVVLGDVAGAQAALADALAIAPQDCAALRTRAALAHDQGDPAGAARDLRACLEAQPDNTEAARALIAALEAGGMPRDAAAVLEAHPAAVADRDLLRARLALRAGDGGAAQSLLADRTDAGATALRALELATRGAWPEAAAAARTARDAHPDSAGAAWLHLGLAAAAGQTAPPPEAPLPGRPWPDPAAAWLAALAAAGAGDPGPALALAPGAAPLPGLSLAGLDRAAIARLADSAAAPWLAAATTQTLLGFDRLARDAAARGAAADPDLALAQLQHGLAAAAGDPRAALAPLGDALRLAPGSLAARLAMAETRARLGHLEAALDHYRTAAAAQERPGLVLRIGLLAERLGRDAEAEAAFDRFIALQPESFVGYNQLAWHLAARNRDLDRALDLARRADALQPGNASILDTIGWVLHLQGDDRAAVEYLRRAHGVAGASNPVIVAHLATVEAALGNAATAARLRAALSEGGG